MTVGTVYKKYVKPTTHEIPAPVSDDNGSQFSLETSAPYSPSFPGNSYTSDDIYGTPYDNYEADMEYGLNHNLTRCPRYGCDHGRFKWISLAPRTNNEEVEYWYCMNCGKRVKTREAHECTCRVCNGTGYVRRRY